MYTEQEITDAFEDGRLFVKCLNTVSDDIGIYNVVGKEYEVVDGTDKYWFVETEYIDDILNDLQILKDDPDFELVIK